MPVTDLGDWLDEQMEYVLEPLLQDADAEYGALWYIKRLSATDTGAGSSNQSGVYVPKRVIFKVIPGLVGMDANILNEQFNLVVDSHGQTRHTAKAIWYSSKPEARVTGLAGSALQDRQSAGNLTVFAFHLATLEEPLRCRVWVCHDADEEALLQERIGAVAGRWRIWPDFTEKQSTEIASFAQRMVGSEADAPAAVRRGIIRAAHSAHNKAVELRAMDEAMRHYREAGWEVEDISLQKLGYDIRCTRDDEELHVEVKGVSSDGSDVNLTRNEVIHAREYRASALFVLSHIEVTYDDTGPVANGGQARIFDPWRVDDDGELTATTYSYRLQPG